MTEHIDHTLINKCELYEYKGCVGSMFFEVGNYPTGSYLMKVWQVNEGLF